MLFVTACACNTQSPIDTDGAQIIIQQVCEPIYGRESDWGVISDDLARNIYRHNRLCAVAKT